ncbi:hypothetical protein GCK72_008607 [Caenorhabditis remanei]|uniref:Uncharacterized protein n=2 Tax=Caenorhabditis remanei TaxID=31234 RepID=A0A6A5GY05_CAERE|nr:hypothetical protein GCK72_008607 [Caenorhabditis remanei]KAF1760358.1 hypothetical protein GCK72_008607 [Caenorhabditis remanei]
MACLNLNLPPNKTKVSVRIAFISNQSVDRRFSNSVKTVMIDLKDSTRRLTAKKTSHIDKYTKIEFTATIVAMFLPPIPSPPSPSSPDSESFSSLALGGAMHKFLSVTPWGHCDPAGPNLISSRNVILTYNVRAPRHYLPSQGNRENSQMMHPTSEHRVTEEERLKRRRKRKPTRIPKKTGISKEPTQEKMSCAPTHRFRTKFVGMKRGRHPPLIKHTHWQPTMLSNLLIPC